MGYADEKLILGRGFPHATAAASFTTTAASFNGTSAVNYLAAPGTNGTSVHDGIFRFVEVANDDASNFLTVSLGSATFAPATATAGSLRVYPRTSRIFQLEQAGVSVISVKGDTGTVAGSINWFK